MAIRHFADTPVNGRFLVISTSGIVEYLEAAKNVTFMIVGKNKIYKERKSGKKGYTAFDQNNYILVALEE